MNFRMGEDTSDRQFIVIVLSVLVLVEALVFAALWQPMLRKIFVTEQTARKFDKEIIYIHKLIRNPDNRLAPGMLAEEQDVTNIVNDMVEKGKNLGISFSSISFKDIKEVKGLPFRCMPVAIEMESNYKAIVSFLDILAQFPQNAVHIDSFKITRQKAPPQVKSECLFKIYLEGKSHAKK